MNPEPRSYIVFSQDIMVYPFGISFLMMLVAFLKNFQDFFVCHFPVTAGSQIAGIRNSFQVSEFIDAQFPQGGGETDFSDKIRQRLHTGAGQFL